MGYQRWLKILVQLNLPSPTNIYGSCSVLHNHSLKLLVAVRNQVYCIYATETPDGNVRWNNAPLVLANIPTDADIISLDCVHLDSSDSSPILGLTVYRDSTKKAVFNIYGANTSPWKDVSDDISVLFSSLDDCQTLELDFIPFRMSHSLSNTGGQAKAKTFLLSGSDNKIHSYFQDSQTNQFVEGSAIDYLPQVNAFPSSVLSYDIKVINSRRFTAFGCQDGTIFLSSTESETRKVSLDGPVSAVHLFASSHQDPLTSPSHPVIAQLQTSIKATTSVAPLPIFAGDGDVHLLTADAGDRKSVV